MDLVGTTGWNNFKTLINSAHDTFNQQTITWLRSKGGLDPYGEDNKTESFTPISLLCLVDYASKIKWPLDHYTESGDLDKENMAILFNLSYLKGLGYLTASGDFVYATDADRIVYNGVTWKCSAMTNVSQAPDVPLLVMLIFQKIV